MLDLWLNIFDNNIGNVWSCSRGPRSESRLVTPLNNSHTFYKYFLSLHFLHDPEMAELWDLLSSRQCKANLGQLHYSAFFPLQPTGPWLITLRAGGYCFRKRSFSSPADLITPLITSSECKSTGLNGLTDRLRWLFARRGEKLLPGSLLTEESWEERSAVVQQQGTTLHFVFLRFRCKAKRIDSARSH